MRDSRELKPGQQSFKEIAVSLLILQQNILEILEVWELSVVL